MCWYIVYTQVDNYIPLYSTSGNQIYTFVKPTFGWFGQSTYEDKL